MVATREGDVAWALMMGWGLGVGAMGGLMAERPDVFWAATLGFIGLLILSGVRLLAERRKVQKVGG